MIECPIPIAFGQPQEAERAMAFIVPGLERTGPGERGDGIAAASERRERHGAAVMRRRIAWFGCDRRIEARKRVRMLALSCGDNAEIVCHAGMIWGERQRRAISRLSLGV